MKVLNLCIKSMVSFAVIATFCGANAAQNGRASMMPATDTARMPTMPTFSLNTIGNPAVSVINEPAEVNNAMPIPTPKPEPKPNSDCPDGGVRNSNYTITNCMNDVLQCVNTGALEGGLHDLFNEDVRNAIMGGMKLCQANIDKCITDVRVNCRNVYIESNNVWLDFNSRIIQPEYYNFVLRKTGLTPNQAENTCLLLDRNTYGSSFAAVSDENAVNSEYKNKVGAYNISDGGKLTKKNPQGVEVNTEGYDGNRGHYARWDASNAECLIRVAAYNKDKLITNSWLFGAVGNDDPAEVWQKAGSTFTCNKDLFDFSSLLNNTRTVAVVGVGGGTLVGAGIGAGVGAANYKRKAEACQTESHRKKLGNYIKNVIYKDQVVNGYVGTIIDYDNMTDTECDMIHDLYSKVEMYEEAISYCDSHLTEQKRKEVNSKITAECKVVCNEETIKKWNIVDVDEKEVIDYVNKCRFKSLNKTLLYGGIESPLCNGHDDCVSSDAIKPELSSLKSLLSQIENGVGIKLKTTKGKEIGKGIAIGAASGAAAGGIATAITALVERGNISCKVGDGLNSVAFGKAHTIDTLKDFYVKWNLHLPDAVSPTSAVIDRTSWEQACSQFNNKLMDCAKVQINLKDAKGKYTLIPAACKVVGNVCTINDVVMTSNGIE